MNLIMNPIKRIWLRCRWWIVCMFGLNFKLWRETIWFNWKTHIGAKSEDHDLGEHVNKTEWRSTRKTGYQTGCWAKWRTIEAVSLEVVQNCSLKFIEQNALSYYVSYYVYKQRHPDQDSWLPSERTVHWTAQTRSAILFDSLPFEAFKLTVWNVNPLAALKQARILLVPGH